MLKLWLLPKVWLQGSQSTTTGGSSATKAKPAAIIAWFEHSMRWVLMTALGFPVEPEVNRNFAMVSGVTCAAHGGDAGVVFGADQIGEQRGLPVAQRIARHHQFDVVRHGGVDRARERPAVIGEHHAGREQVDDRAQFAEVARQQRIGRRDRRIGNADAHRRERQQRVLDVVAGDDGDRPLGRQPAPQQCGADAPGQSPAPAHS